MRVALYWTPERGDPLGQAGNGWLGRDPDRNVPCDQPAMPGLPDATAAPRLYGFHATLRPPMRLATSWSAFCQTATALARSFAPFDLPRLHVADLAGFLALTPAPDAPPCPAIQALADACVRATDPHRRPAGADELAHRRRAGLSPEQDELLLRWGYPHVMAHWRFHMTLTSRLVGRDIARFRTAAEAHFADALAMPRRVTELAVFTQREDGSGPAPFLIAQRLRLGS